MNPSKTLTPLQILLSRFRATTLGKWLFTTKSCLFRQNEDLLAEVRKQVQQNAELGLNNSALRLNVTTLALEFIRLTEYVSDNLPASAFDAQTRPPAEIQSALALRDQFRGFADHPDIIRGTQDLIANILAAQFNFSWIVIYHKVGVFIERLNSELTLDASGHMPIELLYEALRTTPFNQKGRLVDQAPNSSHYPSGVDVVSAENPGGDALTKQGRLEQG